MVLVVSKRGSSGHLVGFRGFLGWRDLYWICWFGFWWNFLACFGGHLVGLVAFITAEKNYSVNNCFAKTHRFQIFSQFPD